LYSRVLSPLSLSFSDVFSKDEIDNKGGNDGGEETEMVPMDISAPSSYSSPSVTNDGLNSRFREGMSEEKEFLI